MKRVFILLSILAFVLLGGHLLTQKFSKPSNVFPISKPTDQAENPQLPAISALALPKSMPTRYLIPDFPFQSQAPLGNWDALHEEACEEASLILTYYWKNNQALNAQKMEEEIQKLVSSEVSQGYPVDLTAKQLGQIADSYYKMAVTVSYEVDAQTIKREIAAGHPVIVPAAGRMLGNPFFQRPGPIYHMVVIIGYDKDNFVVQDVGTKRGDNYIYNSTILLNAIHEWTGNPDTISSGPKSMVIID